MKRFAYLFLGVAALASSCKKDDSTQATTPAVSPKVGLLVGKRWGLTALTAQRGSLSQDGYATLKPCEKDNYIRFNDDRTAEVNEGPSKCSPADAASYAGTWELVGNDSKLLLTTPLFGTGAAGTPDILELTTSRLVLRGVLIDGNGVTTTYTATLTTL